MLRLAVVLALALLPPAPRPVHVVFVGVVSPTEQAQALNAIKRSLAFWHRIDGSIGTIESTTTVSTTASLDQYMQFDQQPIYVLVTPDDAAYAEPYYGVVVVGQRRINAATVAHEFGHVAYKLPDLYHAPCSLDIMCREWEVFESGFVGCVSLEQLGRPCTQVFLPFA